jgi:putative two-component system response regulator
LEEENMCGLPLVLVADDTPENLWRVSSLLKGYYRVKATTSGVKAIEIAKADPIPDLILLDTLMPGMDGYEVCLALKGMAKTRRIPIIFLAARSSPSDRAHGRLVGAVDHIAKPIDGRVILSRMSQHLGKPFLRV